MNEKDFNVGVKLSSVSWPHDQRDDQNFDLYSICFRVCHDLGFKQNKL